MTHRVRLGMMVGSATEYLPALDTLQRLSGGRMVVDIAAGPHVKQNIELIKTVRSGAPPPRILITHDSSEDA